MKSIYQEKERERVTKLLNDNNPIFYNGKGGKIFMHSERDFVLTENEKNIFEPIRKDVIEYFKENNISWWGGKKPTGHLLSSQIACINHLFAIRNDKTAILGLLSSVSQDFIDVFEIETDEVQKGFIQFEAVSDNDYLNEGQSTRGSNCTSVDALIYAKHKDGSKWIIPIEWKYTEHYDNQNKATEGCSKNPDNCKGNERKRRYTELINSSKQLKSDDHYVYYFEPFYQLMRQTLWAEQIIKNKEKETIKADNFLHLHIIPSENKDLLEKKYKCSGFNMETTWKNHLIDKNKYIIISPQNFLKNIDTDKYSELYKYLTIRYWNNV